MKYCSLYTGIYLQKCITAKKKRKEKSPILTAVPHKNVIAQKVCAEHRNRHWVSWHWRKRVPHL